MSLLISGATLIDQAGKALASRSAYANDSQTSIKEDPVKEAASTNNRSIGQGLADRRFGQPFNPVAHGAGREAA